MKKLHCVRIVALFLMAASVAGLSGCTTLMEEDENTQTVPWSQPADWENQLPGMPRGF